MAKNKKKFMIGIDLGGTKIFTVLLDSKFKVRAERKDRVDVYQGEKFFMKSIVAGVNGVLADAKVSPKQLLCAGAGCPGLIDSPKGFVKISPNISFLKNYPLREKLQKLLKVPVWIENDVNAGLYGEHQFGAARGYSHVAGIFMGTGVGGAFILDGELYRGATGGAGEIGHTYLSIPSFLPDSPEFATLESMTGRLAIAASAGFLIAKQKARHLYEEVGYDIKKIKSRVLSQAIDEGDSALKTLVASRARLVGISMANIVNLLSPEIFVLGGGMVEAMPEIILPRARETMKEFALAPMVKTVKVEAAKLKDHSVAMGAAKLAYDDLKESRKGR